MLIATLPPVYREGLLHQIISSDEISGVRYNSGMVSPHTPEDTLSIIKVLTEGYGKKFWVDLKGRQVRITNWAQPDFANIEVNHELEIEGDAWVHFRDGTRSLIKFVHGKVIYLDSPPDHAVGAGQSINVLGDNVKIKGYLTENDRAYIQAAKKLGIRSFMLSFVENQQDIDDVRAEFASGSEQGPTQDLVQNPPQELDFVLKIESPTGVRFISKMTGGASGTNRLMAARDDLFVTIGEDKSTIIDDLKEIIFEDPDAILSSRMFTGIERYGNMTLSDITDIELMKEYGYKNFMLPDNLCHRNFAQAIEAWKMIN